MSREIIYKVLDQFKRRKYYVSLHRELSRYDARKKLFSDQQKAEVQAIIEKYGFVSASQQYAQGVYYLLLAEKKAVESPIIVKPRYSNSVIRKPKEADLEDIVDV